MFVVAPATSWEASEALKLRSSLPLQPHFFRLASTEGEPPNAVTTSENDRSLSVTLESPSGMMLASGNSALSWVGEGPLEAVPEPAPVATTAVEAGEAAAAAGDEAAAAGAVAAPGAVTVAVS